MKKFICAAMAAVMMCGNVFAAEISVNLNGEAVEFSAQEPVIVDGRTLIPLRGVFEMLGYEITWDNDTKTAEFAKDDINVVVAANASEFTVNGESIALDVPAQIINGSMMLPLRAIGEATGLSVSWDSDSKTVDLNSGETVSEEETESVTEKATETTTSAAVENVTKISFTADEIKKAESFVVFAETVEFAQYYMYAMGIYTSEMNGYSPSRDREKIIACLEEVIAVNNAAVERANDIKINNDCRDILNSFKLYSSGEDKLYSALLERYYADYDNIYTEQINSYVRNQNESIEKFYNTVESSTEEYIDGLDWYWSYSDLSASEQTEVTAYQKKVGNILNANLNSGVISGSDSSAKLIEAANAIKEQVSVLETPEKCRIDAEVLILAADLLIESAEIRAEQTNEYDYIYPTALIYAFDICAQNCAGSNYNSAV